MFHHAESPEVISAKLAEWERTVAAHQAERAAARAVAPPDEASASRKESLIAILLRMLRPASRIDQPTSA